MSQWIQTTNSNLRSVKVEGMSDEVWFTDQGYSEVSEGAADILSSAISSISEVAEPNNPGGYYESDYDGTTIEVTLEGSGGPFTDLTVTGPANVGSVDADSVTTDRVVHGNATTNPVSPRQPDTYAFPALVSHPNAENPIHENGDFTLSTGEDVETVADPFVVNDGGMFYLFYEAKESVTPAQDIHYSTSTDGINWTHQGEVISNGNNLSYSQVFKANGKWYMVVDDAGEGAQTTVYSAESFPDSWSVDSTIDFMPNDANDTTVFHYDEHWWLMWEGGNGGGGNNVKLAYADSFPGVGTWSEHPDSPIRISSSPERPGGRPIVHEDHVDIFMQAETDGVYGNELRAYRITDLSPTSYSDTSITGNPVLEGTGDSDVWNGIRMHHADFILNSKGDISFGIVDGGTGEGYWSLGVVAPASQTPVVAELSTDTSQTVSAGSTLSMTIDQALVDSFNALDTANSEWVCPKSGYYRISGQVGISWSGSSDGRVTLDFINRTEGSRETRSSVPASAAMTYQSLSLRPRVMHLSQGDAFGLDIQNTTGSDIDLSTGSDQTAITIERVQSR